MVTSPSQSAPTRVRRASPDGEDVVFTFSMEMLEDAVGREFCRPPDQTLLALARDERIGRLLVADPWRSYVASAARRRSPRLTEPATVDGRVALRVRPHRLRTADSTQLGPSSEPTGIYGSLLGRALARARGEREPRPSRRRSSRTTRSSRRSATLPGSATSSTSAKTTGRPARRSSVVDPLPRGIRAHRRSRGRNLRGVGGACRARIAARIRRSERGDRRCLAAALLRATTDRELPRPRAIYTGTIDDRLEPTWSSVPRAQSAL